MVRVKRSIIAGNLLGTGNVDCTGTITSGGFNLLQNCPGASSANGDKLFVNANLSDLIFPNPGLGQLWNLTPWHSPAANGPAVNAIPNDTEECNSFATPDDQIYNRRFIGGACDMDAIERQ